MARGITQGGQNWCSEKSNPPERKTKWHAFFSLPSEEAESQMFQVAGTGSVITNNVNFESSVALDF